MYNQSLQPGVAQSQQVAARGGAIEVPVGQHPADLPGGQFVAARLVGVAMHQGGGARLLQQAQHFVAVQIGVAVRADLALAGFAGLAQAPRDVAQLAQHGLARWRGAG